MSKNRSQYGSCLESLTENDLEKLKSGTIKQKNDYMRYGLNKTARTLIPIKEINNMSTTKSSMLGSDSTLGKIGFSNRKSINKNEANACGSFSERHKSTGPVTLKQKAMEAFERINTIELPIDQICEHSDGTGGNFSPLTKTLEPERVYLQKKNSARVINSFTDKSKARPMTGDIKQRRFGQV